MIEKIKKVYYCEFCNKHSLNKSLRLHELHCTLNPNRLCRLCGQKKISEIIEKIKVKYKKPDEFYDGGNGKRYLQIQELTKKEGGEIYDEVDNCPNCMLTILRILDVHCPEFNYKKELEKFWKSKNEEFWE